MFAKRFLLLTIALMVALAALSACGSQGDQQPGQTTLQLAVSDEQGYPSEAVVLEFIDQVKTRSNGEINIEPVWNAGDTTSAGFEEGVIQLLRDGKADLGLAASRAWSAADITNFLALQAPFLITDQELAVSVAKSDIATRMLDNLTEAGLVGLTLWPEDLRHPFSMNPEQPILSPADIAGKTIRVTDSGVSKKLIEALGGKTMIGEGKYDGAESGLRQARSLSGKPTATANVTFFPKYQVLFANAEAFNQLSEAQRTILHEAATAAQEKAIGEIPDEAEAARAWCSDVGEVVLASDAQIAEFEKAAQPVFDWIEEDAMNAELVAAIRELKGKTPASPAVVACGTTSSGVTAESDSAAQKWSEGLPPNGTWQVTLTNEDVIKMGVSKAAAPDWSGVYSFTFQDGDFHWTWLGTEGFAKGQTAVCDGTYEVVQDFVRMISDSSDCGNEVDDIQWRLDDDGLHFHVVEIQNGPTVEVTAMFEAKPYEKIGD
jgi:TRAP-type C4-dicarboxylate transport system substrate-binding protein